MAPKVFPWQIRNVVPSDVAVCRQSCRNFPNWGFLLKAVVMPESRNISSIEPCWKPECLLLVWIAVKRIFDPAKNPCDRYFPD